MKNPQDTNTPHTKSFQKVAASDPSWMAFEFSDQTTFQTVKNENHLHGGQEKKDRPNKLYFQTSNTTAITLFTHYLTKDLGLSETNPTLTISLPLHNDPSQITFDFAGNVRTMQYVRTLLQNDKYTQIVSDENNGKLYVTAENLLQFNKIFRGRENHVGDVINKYFNNAVAYDQATQNFLNNPNRADILNNHFNPQPQFTSNFTPSAPPLEPNFNPQLQQFGNQPNFMPQQNFPNLQNLMQPSQQGPYVTYGPKTQQSNVIVGTLNSNPNAHKRSEDYSNGGYLRLATALQNEGQCGSGKGSAQKFGTITNSPAYIVNHVQNGEMYRTWDTNNPNANTIKITYEELQAQKKQTTISYDSRKVSAEEVYHIMQLRAGQRITVPKKYKNFDEYKEVLESKASYVTVCGVATMRCAPNGDFLPLPEQIEQPFISTPFPKFSSDTKDFREMTDGKTGVGAATLTRPDLLKQRFIDIMASQLLVANGKSISFVIPDAFAKWLNPASVELMHQLFAEALCEVASKPAFQQSCPGVYLSPSWKNPNLAQLVEQTISQYSQHFQIPVTICDKEGDVYELNKVSNATHAGNVASQIMPEALGGMANAFLGSKAQFAIDEGSGRLTYGGTPSTMGPQNNAQMLEKTKYSDISDQLAKLGLETWITPLWGKDQQKSQSSSSTSSKTGGEKKGFLANIGQNLDKRIQGIIQVKKESTDFSSVEKTTITGIRKNNHGDISIQFTGSQAAKDFFGKNIVKSNYHPKDNFVDFNQTENRIIYKKQHIQPMLKHLESLYPGITKEFNGAGNNTQLKSGPSIGHKKE